MNDNPCNCPKQTGDTPAILGAGPGSTNAGELVPENLQMLEPSESKVSYTILDAIKDYVMLRVQYCNPVTSLLRLKVRRTVSIYLIQL